MDQLDCLRSGCVSFGETTLRDEEEMPFIYSLWTWNLDLTRNTNQGYQTEAILCLGVGGGGAKIKLC